MKKYKVDFEYVDVYILTEMELTKEIAYELGSECFGLRKSMGECTIELEKEYEDRDYKDITILFNNGDYNIFKGKEHIDNLNSYSF